MNQRRNAYDETPYESYPFPQSHPFRMRTLGMLFGMIPQDVSNCRILELGCASGGNLIPMAEMFPNSECVGIDASREQIAVGNAIVGDLNLKNIQLLSQDICDIDSSLGKFDYVIAHGIYSWIPDNVQQHLLRVCSENLQAHGVAYVSYNTYPGWRLRGMIRDLMIYRGQFFDSPSERLKEGRALLDFLAKATHGENTAFAKLLADEVEGLRTKEDYYLIHEHLEDVNEPVYFHQFMQRAETHGLQYLGEAEYSMMLASNFSTEVANMVMQLVSPNKSREIDEGQVDIIQLEQYIDFVRNRLFRQTLLCHKDISLSRPASHDALKSMYVASSAAADAPYVDIQSRESVLFKRPGSTLTTTEPILKAAMIELADRWPQSVSFSELLRISRSRIHSNAVVVDAAKLKEEESKLLKPLLHCYATTHVDLLAGQFPYASKIASSPVASRLARHQAKCGLPVTNLAHETIGLNDMQRRVLVLLDGSNDQSSLLDSLYQDVEQKHLIVHDQGMEVTEPAQVKSILAKLLAEQLNHLLANKLLLSDPRLCGEN